MKINKTFKITSLVLLFTVIYQYFIYNKYNQIKENESNTVVETPDTTYGFSRYYFEKQKTICYKSAGGAISCLHISEKPKKELSFSEERDKLNSFYIFEDKELLITCYKTVGGKLSCLKNI